MFRLTNGLDDLDGFKKNKSTSGNWGFHFLCYIFCAIKRIRET